MRDRRSRSNVRQWIIIFFFVNNITTIIIIIINGFSLYFITHAMPLQRESTDVIYLLSYAFRLSFFRNLKYKS